MDDQWELCAEPRTDGQPCRNKVKRGTGPCFWHAKGFWRRIKAWAKNQTLGFVLALIFGSAGLIALGGWVYDEFVKHPAPVVAPIVVAPPSVNISLHLGCDPDHLPIHISPATTVHIVRMLPALLRGNPNVPEIGVFEDVNSREDKGFDWPTKIDARMKTPKEMREAEKATGMIATPMTSRCKLTSYSTATLETISATLIIDTTDKKRHYYPVSFEPLLTGSGFTFYLVNVCSSGAVPLIAQWGDRTVVRVLGEKEQRVVPLQFEKKSFPSSLTMPFGSSWYTWVGVKPCGNW
jgi:hypothetical protein